MNSSNIDTEYDAWLIEQSQLLRDRTFEKLDIENLIEELESLVRGEKSAVENLAINILTHLFYCQYWKAEHRSINHWQAEITVFRYQLLDKLSTNLKNHLIARWGIINQRASKISRLKTGLEMPENLYSLEQVLDENFLPQ
jgi:hypothetical protein